MARIRSLVQGHITGRSPLPPTLCCSVSMCPQRTQELVSVRPIAASRSFVGNMSCIARYLVDFTESGTTAACRFFQTLSQRVSGYLRVIGISFMSSIFAVIVRRTPYKRRLNRFNDSFAPAGRHRPYLCYTGGSGRLWWGNGERVAGSGLLQ